MSQLKSKQPFRIDHKGQISLDREIRFKFDGKSYSGLIGDSLASALLANGVHLVGRSFKYHRPRGIVAAGVEEPNALVTVIGRRLPHEKTLPEGRITPNLRATQVQVYDGLVAFSQNRWPSLKFDLHAVNGWFSRFLPAGFYYKTFKGFGFGLGKFGASFAWHRLFEPAIRRSAGLGVAPTAADPDRYGQFFAYCDLLVVGTGAAGLAAAIAAGKTGVRVIVCDEQAAMGGSLRDELDYGKAKPDPLPASGIELRINGEPAIAYVQSCLKQLAAMANVKLMTNSQCFTLAADGYAGIVEQTLPEMSEEKSKRNPPREILWQVRAKAIILATGAIERPLVFHNNDLPGILLAGAAQQYLARQNVLMGRQTVVVTSCDSAYRTALMVVRAGGRVSHIIDQRPAPKAATKSPKNTNLMVAEWSAQLAAAGVTVIRSATIVAAQGGLRINRVDYRRLDAQGVATGETLSVACDSLLMSGGWTPSLHLHSQARGTVQWDSASGNFLPAAPKPHLNFNVSSVGACAGVFGIAAAIAEASAAVTVALKQAGIKAAVKPEKTTVQEPEISWLGSLGAVPHQGEAHLGEAHNSEARLSEAHRQKAFVDFQNDVTERDIIIATREGMRSIEHIKRYTTNGMATDQGKTSNLNALAIAARALGKTIPEVGLTTFRLPYSPVTFGIMAGYARGEIFDPIRTTPMHGLAVENGAEFEDVGQWKRAFYFPRKNESMHDAVMRECLTVRNKVGLFDASTLGKIEIVGADAAEFLERFYINPWKKLAVGRCRYGILLNEQGFVIDDGVVARISEDRFHVTTTTGGAARVLNMMEDYLQTEWPELNLWLTSTSEQFAVVAVQGPLARQVLQGLVEGVDLGAETLPHMAYVEGSIAGGIPMRLFRVSFSGELGFEVNVPSSHGAAVLAALWSKAQPLGGCIYGTEAMHILRAEKGFIIVGQDTDGTATPDDVGMAGAIGKNKLDFVGKRSLSRPDMVAAGRKQFVGLLPLNPKHLLDDGAQIVTVRNPRVGTHAVGHVTSAYFSPILGHSFGLGMVENGRARLGETLFVPLEAGTVAVKIVSPTFYDAKGERLNV